MENLVEEVLHWLMKTAEVLASSGYLAAKQYIIASSTVWLIAGVLFLALLIWLGRFFLKIEREVWSKDRDSKDVGTIAAFISFALTSLPFFVLIVPNSVKLLSPDWYTIELLIYTIIGK